MAEDREAVRAHLRLVREVVYPALLEDTRFPDARRLIARADKIISEWEAGSRNVAGVVEVVNELCVARELLKRPLTAHYTMTYEPKVTLSGASIDFALTYADAKHYFDVKTIRPREPADARAAWAKYEELRELFPDNASIELAERLMGGQFWHYFSSARAKFLDNALSLERKAAALPRNDKTTVRMIYCGEGMRWTRDQLEDFADFYRNGMFRADDALAPLQAHYLTEKGIVIQRTIDGFCCLLRRLTEVEPKEFRLDLRGPDLGRS